MNDRMKWLLEDLHEAYNTFDPFYIIEMSNIELQYVPFANKQRGLYYKVFETPTIFINERLQDSSEKYFVAAHELHHALEHSELSAYYLLNSKSQSKMEQEANAFALTLCMNLYIEENGVESMTSIDLHRFYGVPLELSEILL